MEAKTNSKEMRERPIERRGIIDYRKTQNLRF